MYAQAQAKVVKTATDVPQEDQSKDVTGAVQVGLVTCPFPQPKDFDSCACSC